MDVTLTAEGRNVKCHKVKLVIMILEMVRVMVILVDNADSDDGGYDGGVGYDG